MRGNGALTTGSSLLDELLVEAVVSTRAHIGNLYLLDEDGDVLKMDSQLGLPPMIAKAWARVRTNDRAPIATSVCEQRLVWVPDREGLAREFPSAALSVPYDFASAAHPLISDGTVWGGFVLLWPAGRVSRLTQRQLDRIEDISGQMAEVLQEAAEQGQPIKPGPRPRMLDPRRKADPRPDLIALDCLNRLPEGHGSLDVNGRVTLLSAPAADLLLSSASELLGKRLDQALPWMNDPAYEDAYRAAVVGRQVTHFTIRNPAGRQLSLRFFPGLSGITVRITPAVGARGPGHLAAGAERPAPNVALHEVLYLATKLSRAVTAQEVVDLVADHVMPVYNVQALAILTSKGGRLRVDASRGYSPQAIQEFDGRPVIPPDPANHSFDAGQPTFFSTWDELRKAYPGAVRSDDMSAWAFLPLVISGHPIGTCVLAYNRPHQFSTSERATLTALAGLIAQAYERARLYDVKHQLAQCLQKSLLPRRLPEISGLELAAHYLPATPGMDIGGDFYDLIRLTDTMAAAVIGDVQGHDVTAAALMGQVRTAIHAHATSGASPGEVLARTNRLLSELSPDRFTSCLYVNIDLRKRIACLASAGHLPPLFGRPGWRTEAIDSSPGLLLGVDPDSEYATTEVPMPPGSVLALYTDGLIEEPGRSIGEAIDDLAERFTPSPGQPLHDLAESLIKQATAEQRMDDIAVLLCRT
ncbi:SpoIIE family protein phosphatase [Nonomuraea sp. NPDC003709]|uniref:SpoIIE family protein phosphatase n=1 Tax=Nonomuraea sp. NPDC003709 TaxID=3154450 RepID=UPI0033AF89E6